MPHPIIKGTVRILRPSEYEKLRESAEILDKQTRLDALLLTGVRYVQAERLQEHPDWVDGRFVHRTRICTARSSSGSDKATV